MTSLRRLLGRVHERQLPSSSSAPGADDASELREAEGQSGLHGAAASGNLAKLQQHWWKKRLFINGRDKEKQTPLHLACTNGHADVVEFLAGHKCQLNPKDKWKKSPLMKAVQHEHRDCAAILLKHGANPNLGGPSGNTALHIAVLVRSKPLVTVLLEHQADIEAKNVLGYTPFLLAVTTRCEEMMEFLVQRGADVHVRDSAQRNALMLAMIGNDPNIVRRLLQYGVDLSAEDHLGRTAEFYTISYPNDDISRQLEQYKKQKSKNSATETNAPAEHDDKALAEHDTCSTEESAEKPKNILAQITQDKDILLPKKDRIPAEGAEKQKSLDCAPDTQVEDELSSKTLEKKKGSSALHAHPLLSQCSKGVSQVTKAEQMEDDFSLPESQVEDECSFKSLNKKGSIVVHSQPVSAQCSKGVSQVTKAEQKKDDFSLSEFEVEDECSFKSLNKKGSIVVHSQPVSAQCSKGVSQVTKAEQKEDDFSLSQFEVEDECSFKSLNKKGSIVVHSQPVSAQCSKGVSQVTKAEQKEDDFSLSEFEVEDECSFKSLNKKGSIVVHSQPVSAQCSKGVSQVTKAEQKKDDFSLSEFEVEDEQSTKPIHKKKRSIVVHSQPVSAQCSKGVSQVTKAEQKEDDFSLSEFEVEDECSFKSLNKKGSIVVHSQPVSAQCSKGVSQVTKAEQKKDDFSLSEFEVEDEQSTKPIHKKKRSIVVHSQPVSAQCSKGVSQVTKAEQKEDDFSFPESQVEDEQSTKPIHKKKRSIVVHSQPVSAQCSKGVSQVRKAEQKKDDFSLPESQVEDECSFKSLNKKGSIVVHSQPVSAQCSKGVSQVTKAEQKEDDFSFPESQVEDEQSTKPIHKKKRSIVVHSQFVSAQCSKDVSPVTKAEQKKDDFSFPESQVEDEQSTKPIHKKKRSIVVHSQPVSAQCSKGVSQVRKAEQKKDDFSLPESQVEDECSFKSLNKKGSIVVHSQPVSAQCSKGVSQVTKAEQKEDDFSLSQFEVEDEQSTKPIHKKKRSIVVHSQPVSAQCSKDVSPVTKAEQKKDDFSFPESQVEDEQSTKPIHKKKRSIVVHSQPVSAQCSKGVSQVRKAEQKKDDFSLPESQVEFEALVKPLHNKKCSCASHAKPLSAQCNKGVSQVRKAEQKKDDFSLPESQVEFEALVKPLHNKKCSCASHAKPLSAQCNKGVSAAEVADWKKDLFSLPHSQRQAMQLKQPLDNALKRAALAEASLKFEKQHIKQLQKLKVDLKRSKAQVQELKKQHVCTNRYVKSLKNTLRDKERELTSLQTLDALLATSTDTQVLKDHVHRLQLETAKLEATVQYQAKTTEILENNLQIFCSISCSLDDCRASFQITQTAKEHQNWQQKSEKIKTLSDKACQTEELLDAVEEGKIKPEEEHSRLVMLTQKSPPKTVLYAWEEPRQNFQGKTKNSCSEEANKADKLERMVTNAALMAPQCTHSHTDAVEKGHAVDKLKSIPRLKVFRMDEVWKP
ncbi:ankyrin repeat domain-containing protein 18B-like isoform X3 [Colius striatus]|uniref:ankyrin repeat domain-containing protein 18B-like isoform X3 n=1 Tax=Colius striatus TaxID=57412 RepID=UPI002B1DE62D|nr:ankyrin repeat domain-containing protein 18B-like isoform X3 [Colius striatus]